MEPQPPIVFTHLPCSHACPVAHLLPQAPQLLELVWVSTHWALQQSCPGGHLTPPLPPHFFFTHLPCLHVCPDLQALPQAPQLLGSLWVLVHWPLQQSCLLAGHLTPPQVHLSCLHACLQQTLRPLHT